MARRRTNDGLTKFDGSATIRTVDTLYAALCGALSKHKNIVLDLTGLTEVDLSFVQLLLAARKSVSRDGKQLRLSAPADGVLREALLLGGFLTADEQTSPEADFWLNKETVQ